jgi:hypothetical protein
VEARIEAPFQATAKQLEFARHWHDPACRIVEAVVEDLREKGVTFEQYDLPDTTREGGIHVTGDMRAAWFKDPDGNILSLVNQAM